MKVIIAICLFVILFLSSFFIMTQVHAQASENPDRPIIDDGTGNGSYGTGSTKMLGNVLKLIFFAGFNSDDPSDSIDNPTGPTATPIPNGLPITPLPANTGEGQYADEVVKYAKASCQSARAAVTADCIDVENPPQNPANPPNPLCIYNSDQKIYLKKGIITSDNKSCVDNFAPIMNSDGRTELTNSARDNSYLQCVGFVRGMAKARNRPYTTNANAIDHAKETADPNYSYKANNSDNYDMLVEGSLVIIDLGTFGHIAYVTSIERNPVTNVPYSVTVAEANYGYYLNGSITHGRSIALVGAGIVGWQKPN